MSIIPESFPHIFQNKKVEGKIFAIPKTSRGAAAEKKIVFSYYCTSARGSNELDNYRFLTKSYFWVSVFGKNGYEDEELLEQFLYNML